MSANIILETFWGDKSICMFSFREKMIKWSEADIEDFLFKHAWITSSFYVYFLRIIYVKQIYEIFNKYSIN